MTLTVSYITSRDRRHFFIGRIIYICVVELEKTKPFIFVLFYRFYLVSKEIFLCVRLFLLLFSVKLKHEDYLFSNDTCFNTLQFHIKQKLFSIVM